MSEKLSIRLNQKLKQRLDALARRTGRPKSAMAADAISRYVDAEEWPVAEIEAGIADLENGNTVSHAEVVKWLKSWGTRSELTAPL
jgi:predicted transcriptional regulator